ncbi:hypothetical protein D3C86_942050 [compost metagenome]
MAHDRQVFPRRDDALEQLQQLRRILVADKTLRPVRHGLGADADVLQVWQIQQRLDVTGQGAGVHDHRVAAGNQHVGHFGVHPQVTDQLLGLTGVELEFFLADELRPAETEGAVRVTGLTGTGEKQHGLAVLVLDARQDLAVEGDSVVGQLPGRMRVHAPPDRLDPTLDRRAVILLDQLFERGIFLRQQHVLVGKSHAENRIVRNVVPVDQRTQHIFVGAKRHDPGHHGHGLLQRRRQLVPVRCVADGA